MGTQIDDASTPLAAQLEKLVRNCGVEPWTLEQMALGDYLVSYFNIKTASKRAFVESLEENYAADGNMSTETIL